jgi:circadian clock protein KaiC
MIDSGILMRAVELNSSMRRMVSIMKHRESWFDPAIREFTVGQGGIIVGDRFEASSLLTGSAEPEPVH